MATYAADVTNDAGSLTWNSLHLTEQHLYGAARVGTALTDVKLYPEVPKNPHLPDTIHYPIFEGWKHYEISNHLGNVLAVITDRKRAGNTSGAGITWFDADVVSAQQYYPFGMIMPDTTSTTLRRQYSNSNCFDKDYRYGFNGKEGDDEVKGDDNQQDYGMRIYDPRVGRFLSVDPIAREYPWYTPYQFAGNMPIWAVDLDGLEPASKGTTGQYELAPEEGSGEYFGWYWNAAEEKWGQGEATQYSLGIVDNNSPDDDLTKSYHAGQKVSSIFCGNSERCHYYTFLSGFAAGISLENYRAVREAGVLFQRFESGNGDQYSFGLHTEMSRILGEDAGFVNFAKDFEFDAIDYYKANGTLDGFEGLEGYKRPYIKDTWYMHTVMGGNQQIDAQIQSISADRIIVLYRVWDHFGAGRDDASSKLPGLPSLYWLQHESWLSNPDLRDTYQPFIWNIEVKRK